MKAAGADELIDRALGACNAKLSKVFDADILFLRSPLMTGVDSEVRRYIEDMQAKPGAVVAGKQTLGVVIETSGGFIEVVERIYAVFRQNYKRVIFVVPDFAYSAGTVLVLSGDDIYMDYYSVLGPIDPQIDGEDGNSMPGIGYLNKFNELKDTVNNSPNARAELAYLIKRFDPGKLFVIEQARRHAISLLETWLPKHKFKDWKTTETTKQTVTDDMKKKRAADIAGILGDPTRWHSHGRGISIENLCSEEIRLKINDFGTDVKLSKPIREYYELTIGYLGKIGQEYAIHGPIGLRSLS